jgi:uncharacterized protein YecE (DUF72 family)
MNKVHVGTMGWSYKFWTDDFYPEDLPAEKFLSQYSKHFDTVEVNNTFYRIPSESMTTKWKSETPDAFLFSAKFPRVITHQKMLKDCEEQVKKFIEEISRLQPKLGPLLLQFPPSVKKDFVERLENFLASLPKGYRFAVEVRNREMFKDELYSVLREHNVALVHLDRPPMPKIDTVTADFAYIRWEGDRTKVNGTLGKVEVDRTNEIKDWARNIERLMRSSSEIFGYFSKYYSGYPPDDARQLLRVLTL